MSVSPTHAGELREDFDIEAGSFFLPRMVSSTIDTAILLRPAARGNGELERELTTMLSYYLTGRPWGRSYRTPTSNE